MKHCTISCIGPASGVFVYVPGFVWIEHCLITGANGAILVWGDGSPTAAQVTINYNKIQNCRYNSVGIQFNGLVQDPALSINWCELTNVFGTSQPSDSINIYRSSGLPGRPIQIWNNYVSGVAPANPSDPTFTAGGIVMDGETGDPNVATAHVDIGYNQVVGCPESGIALAFGLHEIAHDNTVVSAGTTQTAVPVLNAICGLAIEGRYQPIEWLQWLQLVNNTVSVNGYRAIALWYPELSGPYVIGNRTASLGTAILADEQAQWQAWQKKLAAGHMTVGP